MLLAAHLNTTVTHKADSQWC